MMKKKLPKKMTVGAFEADCLAVLDEVQAKRVTVVIPKHGKPVAKLVPVESQSDDIFGFLRGKGAIIGDVVSLRCRGVNGAISSDFGRQIAAVRRNEALKVRHPIQKPVLPAGSVSHRLKVSSSCVPQQTRYLITNSPVGPCRKLTSGALPCSAHGLKSSVTIVWKRSSSLRLYARFFDLKA